MWIMNLIKVTIIKLGIKNSAKVLIMGEGFVIEMARHNLQSHLTMIISPQWETPLIYYL